MTEITFWYMRDNHTFRQLPHNVEEALEAVREEYAAGNTYGMLTTSGRAKQLNPFTDDDGYCHGRADWAEFEPRARKWLETQMRFYALDSLKAQVEKLIENAKQHGFVVTIETVPTQPPAMGHYTMVADVRPARK